MWARYPRNLPPSPFTSDVMREIGNSYLLSDARRKLLACHALMLFAKEHMGVLNP